MSFLTNAVMVKQHRLETAKQHHLRQAVHYRRVGSASYRSTSDRFGCGADAAMQGRKAAENPRLAESKLSDRACIGLYADIQRDPRGSYWDTARSADAGLGYQPDSLWFRDSKRGDVRAMVRRM